MKKLTSNEFIERSIKIHNGKYDYSKVEYVNSQTKVCIICPEHGDFWQTPNSHLQGKGCKYCGGGYSQTKEDFIKKAMCKHGDKYDYSNVNYINAHTKINIICAEHGEFWQSPNLHLNGCGCPKCGKENTRHKNTPTTEDFIRKANKRHHNKYDYSKVEYVNKKTNVCIICPEHGEFWQTPDSHLQGNGCRLCSNKKLSKERKLKNEEFIKRSEIIHNFKYDYSKTMCEGYYSRIKIICPIHGAFEQLTYDHLQGKGCRKCNTSKLENECIKYFDKNNIRYIHNYRPKWLSVGKSHLSVDFFLIDYNIAIECQGVQHFRYCKFFERRNETIFERDVRKKSLCDKNNVTLLYIANEKVDNYIGKIYVDINDLIKDLCKNNEKRFL